MNATSPVAWLNRMHDQPPRKIMMVTSAGSLSYGELAQRSAAARSLFEQRGLRAGQHVLLAVSDERHLLCLLVGACSAGLVAMIGDPELPADGARALVERYEPDDVILDSALAERWGLPGRQWPLEAEPPAKQGALLRRLLGREREPVGGFLASLDACSVGEAADIELDAAAPALAFFTSGSTSSPRAVQVSHHALDARLALLVRQHGYDADARLLDTLPLHHMDGLVQGVLAAIFAGATLYRPIAFTAQNVPRYLDVVYAEAITHMVAVPTMLAMMLRLGARQQDAFGGSGFRHVISSAGHLEESLWRRFEAHFSVRVCCSYGLTETTGECIFSGPGDASHRVGSLGLPVGCEVRLLTADAIEAGPGETGEILIRDAAMMLGYYRDEQATAAALRDGWLHTGDLAWRDEHGFLHFAGRSKNIVVSGGHNIQPVEVDEVLGRHPGVEVVATLGLAHADWEAIVVSAVVPMPGAESDEAALLAHCRLFLAPYKVPRRIVFLESLPYGPSGKVRLDLLRPLCEAGSGAGAQDATVEARVMSLARQAFRGHAGELGLASGPDNTMGWDSLAHIEFIAALDDQFGIELGDREIVAITHLGAAVEVIGRRLARG